MERFGARASALTQSAVTNLEFRAMPRQNVWSGSAKQICKYLPSGTFSNVMPETSFTSGPVVTWQGDIIAGLIQTENWSAELQASRERLVLVGPRGMRYELAAENVKEVRIGVGRFLFFTWVMKKTVRIVHSEPGIDAVLAFRARKAKASEIVSELQALGFNVGTAGPEVT